MTKQKKYWNRLKGQIKLRHYSHRTEESYILWIKKYINFSFTVVDWIDIFTRKEYKTVITDSLNYCIKNKGLNVFAWCLMFNHLHLFCWAEENFMISDIIRDLKKIQQKIS